MKKNIEELNHHETAEKLRQLSRLYITTLKYRIKYENLIRGKLPYLFDSEKQEEWSLLLRGWIGSEGDAEVVHKITEDGEIVKDDVKLSGKKQVTALIAIQTELTKEMKKMVALHPWSTYFDKIPGAGPYVTATIIGELDGARYGHIEKGEIKEEEDGKPVKLPISPLLGYGRKFESTSDLWSYAGWGVRDGKAARRKVGEKASWNNYLKAACYQFGDQAVRQVKGPYRKVYDDRKAYEMETHPELTKGHIEKRVRRYTIKKFLSDINHDLVMDNDVVTFPDPKLV